MKTTRLVNQEILLIINNEPQRIITKEQGTYTYNYTQTEIGVIITPNTIK